MLWFIIAIIIFLITIGAIIYGVKASDGIGITVGVVGAIVGGVLMFFSTFYANGVGEAKIIVNAFDRHVVTTTTTPMSGFHAPWEDTLDFDLLSQGLTYAGAPGNAPQYAGGKVSGAEVTVSVGGIAGGSTQANVDMTVTYNIDGAKLGTIYDDFITQERFTQMVVEKQTLDSIRQIPSSYTAIDFRGGKRGEAAIAIQKSLNDRPDFQKYGVNVTAVTIQDVRYSQSVEDALAGLEVAAQQKQKAQLEADAAITKAKGEAQAKIEQARGESESNKLLNDSLTEKVLQSRYIDAINKATTVYVTDGKTPIMLQK